MVRTAIFLADGSSHLPRLVEHDLLNFLVVDQIGTALFFVQVSIYTNTSRWQQKWVNDFPVPCALKFDMTCTMDVLSSLTRALLDPEEIEEWYVVVYFFMFARKGSIAVVFRNLFVFRKISEIALTKHHYYPSKVQHIFPTYFSDMFNQ